MSLKQTEIGQFDQVKLLTSKNVSYLSAPPETKVSPKGLWSVVGIVSDDLLLAQNSVLIRIPATDVLLITKYDLGKITNNLGKLSNVKKEDYNGR